MAELKPKKIVLSEINNGQQIENGDGVQPNLFNAPVEASAYAQALATTQPNLENVNNFGTPSVSIEEVDGLPRFKFENLNAVEISKVEQTVSSTESGGENVLSVYLNNGSVANFSVYNGKTGAKLVSRVLQGQDQDGGNIYLDTFDDGTTAYFTAPKGEPGYTPTIQDWLGTKPIGDEAHYIYYDGEKFVERPVSIKDETTEWSQIAFMADQISKGEKTPEELGLAVGQERTVTLSTGEEVVFVILGFNHDNLADGSGKAGITFGMRDILRTPYEPVTYPTGTNSNANWNYDWDKLNVSNILLSIYDTLPTDLKQHLKIVSKERGYIYNYDSKGIYGSNGGRIDVENCSLFLFSYRELGGNNNTSTNELRAKWGIGTRYPYYSLQSSGSNKVPSKSISGASAVPYAVRCFGQLREAISGTPHSLYACAVSSGGIAVDYTFAESDVLNVVNPIYICFGFCI